MNWSSKVNCPWPYEYLIIAVGFKIFYLTSVVDLWEFVVELICSRFIDDLFGTAFGVMKNA